MMKRRGFAAQCLEKPYCAAEPRRFMWREDQTNAEATWVDQEVCIDQKHQRVTSRRPDDLPAFMAAFIAMLK